MLPTLATYPHACKNYLAIAAHLRTLLPTYVILTSLLPFFAYPDEPPTSSQLAHVRELHSAHQVHNPIGTEIGNDHIDHQLLVLICDGLSPVPARLVERINQGLFIEMSELLPDHLSSANANVGDHHANKAKLTEVDNILD